MRSEMLLRPRDRASGGGERPEPPASAPFLSSLPPAFPQARPTGSLAEWEPVQAPRPAPGHGARWDRRREYQMPSSPPSPPEDLGAPTQQPRQAGKQGWRGEVPSPQA